MCCLVSVSNRVITRKLELLALVPTPFPTNSRGNACYTRARASVLEDGKNFTPKGLNCKVRKYDGSGFNPEPVFFY